MAGCKKNPSDPETEEPEPVELKISSIEPSEGVVGTVVTITGSGFSENVSSNQITFGDIEAGADSASATVLKTTVPKGATTGKVKVNVRDETAEGPEFEVITEGTLQFMISTLDNPNLDSDGYTILIDGVEVAHTSTDERVTLNKIKEGTHQLAITDVSNFCSPLDEVERSVNIAAGDTLTVEFQFTCQPVLRDHIIFSSNENDAFLNFEEDAIFNIYIANPDGSNILNITDGDYYASFPFPSPDGTQIVFLCGFAEDEICIKNVDGSNLKKFNPTPERDLSPMWSPDGEKIIFRNKNGTYTMNLSGTKVEEIPGVSGNSRWSPDGSYALYIYGDDIVLFNFEESKRTYLTDTDGIKELFPNWSPDGTEIVYTSDEDGDFEIYKMNLSSKKVTKLTDNVYPDTSPRWSPDGQKIMFRSNRGMNDEIYYYELYMMNVDGNDQTNLYNFFVQTPEWSPKLWEVVGFLSIFVAFFTYIVRDFSIHSSPRSWTVSVFFLYKEASRSRSEVINDYAVLKLRDKWRRL